MLDHEDAHCHMAQQLENNSMLKSEGSGITFQLRISGHFWSLLYGVAFVLCCFPCLLTASTIKKFGDRCENKNSKSLAGT